jgi:deoxyribodipyrimidine photo-lyase
MKNFNSQRVFARNQRQPDPEGDYVLYWMSINRRLSYNFALEYAVGWANKLGKPLLIYEGLSTNIPWASDRFHQFLLEGMAETQQECARMGISYYSYAEQQGGEGSGLVEELAARACVVIADEYPVYIIRPYNRLMARKVQVPYITVDANGLIPLGATDKAPYSAYIFRKIMQKKFKDAWECPPRENPLEDLQNRDKVTLRREFLDRWPDATPLYADIPATVSRMNIDHSVTALSIKGTREQALSEMSLFLARRLKQYGEHRNDPDLSASSGLSPWLHYGKISEYEIAKAALDHQPPGWSLDHLRYQNGQRDGFFGGDPNVEGFLDELITWREVGFHFCHHVPNYDKFESLPDWAIQSLEEHSLDERAYVYTYEQLENAQTHDPIWNAAQRQLVRDGIIHNYLRMLWGKKVLEWTPDPRTALEYLIELNNKFAIDGRDPNSYSGIFWIFGRFDRAWGPERPIYGKIRYMTSDSTAKKVQLKKYLLKYRSNNPLL